MVAWTTVLVGLAATPAQPPFFFEEVAQQSGIEHLTIYGGEAVNRFLLETTGSGAAFVDVDNDGWLDVFLVNGARLEQSHPEALSRLYRNRGGGAFEDITDRAGVGWAGWGQAVCAGDYDNDGLTDLLVTYWGQNRLYRNRGEGRFEEVSAAAGLTQDRRRWNSGCAFLDYDRDGRLDLFVANYIDFEPDSTPTPDSGLCLYKGVPVACGPPGLQGGQNILYGNRGDGTFEDRSQPAGIAPADGTYSLGVLTADFNGDGWVDIYVANDSNPSSLLRNNRDGTFTDIGVISGSAYSQDGKPQAGMGVSAGDYDRDGDLDIFKTNFAEDSANLYRNLGQEFFEEAAFLAGIGRNTRYLGWGCGLADFDNDGWLDIFQVNGHVYPEVEQLDTVAGYRQPKLVYHNLRNGKFADVTRQAGPSLSRPQAGRGAAFGDYDNDGDLDVLVNNVNQSATLYRNQSVNSNHWLALRLLGKESNRNAIGARAVLRAGSLRSTEEVRSGGSYYSQSQFRLHFGLGSADRVDELEVRWPSGRVQRWENLPVDRLLVIREGSEALQTEPTG